MARKHVQIQDSEVEFPADVQLVSTTDLRGVITYANPAFCRIAGYQVDELVGHNHNLVRHPDMPKAAFADLWDRLKEGNPWRGMVKNRCKDGRYYWVDAYVTPIYENGKISGYQSVRCKPEPQLKQVAAQAYQALLKAEQGGTSKLPSLHSARPLLLGLLMLVLFGWAAFSQGALTVLLMLLPLLAVAGTYWRELISLPRYLKRLGQQYDSLTRLVYSGDAPAPSPISISRCCRPAFVPCWVGSTTPPIPCRPWRPTCRTLPIKPSSTSTSRTPRPSRWPPP